MCRVLRVLAVTTAALCLKMHHKLYIYIGTSDFMLFYVMLFPFYRTKMTVVMHMPYITHGNVPRSLSGAAAIITTPTGEKSRSFDNNSSKCVLADERALAGSPVLAFEERLSP